jgi:hypothetical protein
MFRRSHSPAQATAGGQACLLPRGHLFLGRGVNREEFRKELNSQLDFALKPAWTINIEPKHPEANCGDGEFANVENPPYREHRGIYINASYGWTADLEVSVSPRKFDFVTNCIDYRAESDRLRIVLRPYTAKSDSERDDAMAKRGSVLLGKAACG